MKSIKKIITAAAFIFAISALSAQTPPPPNDGQTPGQGENTPVGGGGAIGGGLFILLGLGAAYGGKKIYKMSKKLNG